MQRFEAAYGRVLDALALIACALILGMTLMICADVLLRNVRIIPAAVGLEWANEIGWANAVKSSPQYGEQLKKVLAK